MLGARPTRTTHLHYRPRLLAGCYSSPSVDAAAYALQDTLTVALYRTSTTFGAGLGKVRGGQAAAVVKTPVVAPWLRRQMRWAQATPTTCWPACCHKHRRAVLLMLNDAIATVHS